jgi:site-specific recombinase XerD
VTGGGADEAALQVLGPGDLGALGRAVERARDYAGAARAENTRRSYGAQWRRFCAWCAAADACPLPASGAVVAAYLAELADRGLKTASITLALTAVNQAHLVAGAPPPREDAAVRETYKGIRRTLGTAQRGKAPLFGAPLLAALDSLPKGLAGARDRAILLLGFAGAFRRSELAALQVEDLVELPEGFEATIQRSKTDQDGRGRKVPIPREARAEVCPCRAVTAWIKVAGITGGPLLRAVDRWGRVSDRPLSAHKIALVVKVAAAAAGLDQRHFAGHSLRSGLVTAAVKAGRSYASIKRTTGHTSDTMVQRYFRDAERFVNPAASGLLAGAVAR